MKYSKELHDQLRKRDKDSDASYVQCLLDEIERLQAERVWTPVSRGLPKETARFYWCSVIDEDTCKAWQEKRYLFSDGKWDLLIEAVTHWMPLPPPPEEEE